MLNLNAKHDRGQLTSLAEERAKAKADSDKPYQLAIKPLVIRLRNQGYVINSHQRTVTIPLSNGVLSTAQIQLCSWVNSPTKQLIGYVI